MTIEPGDIELEVETETYPCAFCREPIATRWVKGGGMLSAPDHMLAGSWVVHSSCWDAMVLAHPIAALPPGAGDDPFDL